MELVFILIFPPHLSYASKTPTELSKQSLNPYSSILSDY